MNLSNFELYSYFASFELLNVNVIPVKTFLGNSLMPLLTKNVN